MKEHSPQNPDDILKCPCGRGRNIQWGWHEEGKQTIMMCSFCFGEKLKESNPLEGWEPPKYHTGQTNIRSL